MLHAYTYTVCSSPDIVSGTRYCTSSLDQDAWRAVYVQHSLGGENRAGRKDGRTEGRKDGRMDGRKVGREEPAS
jgi:hypothetical protein